MRLRRVVPVWPGGSELLREEGFEALVTRQPGQGALGALNPALQKAVGEGLAEGRWRRALDVQRWLAKEHGVTLSLRGVYYYLGKAGGVLKVPRKTHAKKRRGPKPGFQGGTRSQTGRFAAGTKSARARLDGR